MLITAMWEQVRIASPSIGKEVVRRNIPQDQALDELVALLKADGKWQEP